MKRADDEAVVAPTAPVSDVGDNENDM